MKVGDRIRIQSYMFGTLFEMNDYTIEEFRYCLGFFKSGQHRTMEIFTPLFDLYERGPESEDKYLSNMGEYVTNKVQSWMNIPQR